jgi:hypothetical protein
MKLGSLENMYFCGSRPGRMPVMRGEAVPLARENFLSSRMLEGNVLELDDASVSTPAVSRSVGSMQERILRIEPLVLRGLFISNVLIEVMLWSSSYRAFDEPAFPASCFF